MILPLPPKLEAFREAIEKTVRPYIAFDPIASTRTTFAPWESQLGPSGHPYLPIDEEYPCDRETGRPLLLLAQINFADVPRLPPFPERGLLQIFISDAYVVERGDSRNLWGKNERDPRDQTHFRVLFHPSPRTNAAELFTRDDFGFLPAFEFAPDVAYRLAFAPEIAAHPVFDDDRAFADLPAEARSLILYDLPTRRAYLRLRGEKDQIGGYHYSQQGWDPRGEDDPPSELLLQIGGGGPISWGDGGTACFFIPTADLVERRFDRVLYHWDCT